jgi:hypothetical protein
MVNIWRTNDRLPQKAQIPLRHASNQISISDRRIFEAAHVLMMMEQAAKPAEASLLKLVDVASPTVTFHAASVLRYIAQTPLEKHLSHPYWRVRIETLETFARRQTIKSISLNAVAKLKVDPAMAVRARLAQLKKIECVLSCQKKPRPLPSAALEY